MAKNYFILHDGVDLDKIEREIINWFKNRQYEVEFKRFDRQYLYLFDRMRFLKNLAEAA